MNTHTQLNDRHLKLLNFFLLNSADPAKLKEHFNLTPRELIDFLTSSAVRDTLDSIAETLKSAVGCIAISAGKVAMKHLEQVCETYSQSPDDANRLRMAAASLGSLVRHATRYARVARTPEPPVCDEASSRSLEADPLGDPHLPNSASHPFLEKFARQLESLPRTLAPESTADSARHLKPSGVPA